MKKHFKSRYSFKNVSKVFTLRHLSYILGEKQDVLQKIAIYSKKYYHPFLKKRGLKKRKIDQPTGVLKEIQTKICDRILRSYPLSDVVYGAIPKHDIRKNAEQHIGQKIVVRIDLKDCFHSTKKMWVKKCFLKQFGYSPPVASLLTDLCTYNDSVPVGSPLSSMLVNVVYDPLWQKIATYCKEKKHHFTVWVDDLIISGPEADKLIPQVRSMINKRGIRIGWEKLQIQRNNHPQEVTGCSVNKKLGIPSQKRKEYIKFFKEAIKDPKKILKAKGRLAHVSFVNIKQGKQLGKIIKTL